MDQQQRSDSQQTRFPRVDPVKARSWDFGPLLCGVDSAPVTNRGFWFLFLLSTSDGVFCSIYMVTPQGTDGLLFFCDTREWGFVGMGCWFTVFSGWHVGDDVVRVVARS